MPYWYNDVKEGEKFATPGQPKWEELNSAVTASECVVRNDEAYYYLFGWITSITDIKKYGNNDWKFEPQLMMLKFAKKDYEQYDKVSKKKVEVKQHTIEKLACKVFSTLDENIVYKSAMTLQSSNIVKMLVDGVDTLGNPMSDMMYNSMLASYFHFVPILGIPEKLAEIEIKIPSKQSSSFGFGGSKGQAEIEILNDRLKFAIEQLSVACPGMKITSLSDIAVGLVTYKDAPATWDLIIQLIK
jgi:hypothetical protein